MMGDVDNDDDVVPYVPPRPGQTCPACGEPMHEATRFGENFLRWICLDPECHVREVQVRPDGSCTAYMNSGPMEAEVVAPTIENMIGWVHAADQLRS